MCFFFVLSEILCCLSEIFPNFYPKILVRKFYVRNLSDRNFSFLMYLILIVCLHFEIRANLSAWFVCVWWHKSFWVRERMSTKKNNDQYDSILNKLGFDANDLFVDQNSQYNKILYEDFTLRFVKYLHESSKTWEEGYQLIKQYVLD